MNAERSTTRPNILFVMADQLSSLFLAEHGGPAITPHLDRLRSEGLSFSSAYSNSPLCAPARFAMMSGQLNSKIGAYDNAAEFASSVPTFAHHLRAAGYQTSLVGKMHFIGPDQLHGYEERLTTDIYPADFGWTPDWADPDGRFDRWFHNMGSVTGAGIVTASNQLDYDDDVGHQAVRKLRDLARSRDDRPWFLTVSFTHPHDPYVARREFWDRYDDVDIPPPTVGREAPADPHSDRLRRVIGADLVEPTAEQIGVARRAYLANASYVDDHLGRLVGTLDALGLADDTTILFTADHGDMLGERGLWYKMCFFEHACRIPFVLHAPGRLAAGARHEHVSLLDVAPTLLDLAGVDVPDEMDGASVVPSGDEPPDRTVLGEYLAEGAIAPIFMIRRGDHKFVWSRPDPPLLYDVAADPHELTNLATDPAHADVVAAYTSELFERWDPDDIEHDVLASQRARRLVDRALREGHYTPWDHQPVVDAAQQYMRNHMDLDDVEAGRRA